MESSPQQYLPQETIDAIVDFAAALDSPAGFKTLKTLSSTSRVFVHQSRVHLFKKLCITPKDYGEVGHFTKALEMLRDGACGAESDSEGHDLADSGRSGLGLARYVREVEVQFDFDCVTPRPYPLAWGDVEDELRQLDGLIEELRVCQGVLARIFSVLGKLETLTLVHSPSCVGGVGCYSVVWGGIRKALREALCGMVVRSGGTLRQVMISGFGGVPMGMLTALQVLEVLNLVPASTTVGGAEGAEAADGERERVLEVPWKLKSLTAGSGFELLDPYSGRFMMSGVYERLTHLRLSIGTMESNLPVWNIVNCASRTLVVLELDYRSRRDDPSLFYECFLEALVSDRKLPDCPYLQYLSIKIAGEGESARAGMSPSVPCTIPGLPSLLLKGASLPSLQVFSLFAGVSVSAEQFVNFPYLKFVDRQLGWESLDDHLADKSVFPHLRAVRVAVDVQLVEESFMQLEDEDGYEAELEDLQVDAEYRVYNEIESAMCGVGKRVEKELFNASASFGDAGFLEFVECFWPLSR